MKKGKKTKATKIQKAPLKLKTKNQEKPISVVWKILIPVITLVILELGARGMANTVFKSFLAKTDLRTKTERIFIPPPEPSTENVLRLYVYGGSTTQGFPLPKTGFPAQLSYQLHHIFKGKNVDVKNLGWSGFTSTMDRYTLVSTFWHKPDAMIVYVSHNEFVHPEIDSIAFYKGLSKIRDSSALFRMLLATSSSAQKTNSAENSEPIDRKRNPYLLLRPYYWTKMEILKKNYQAMVQIAKAGKVPLIFITATSNTGDWPPPEKPVTNLPLNKMYQADIKAVRSLLSQDQVDQAQKITTTRLKRNPKDPAFLYFQGQIEAKRENWDKAKDYFEKAKNFDLLQWRASDEINNFVRSLGDNKTVWVLDADKIFKENSDHNITGYSLFLDNVHPNITGHNLLANSIVDLLKKDKIVEKDWWDNAGPPLSQDEIIKEIGLTDDDKFEIDFITAVYCIKNPFFNFECAKSYLSDAEKIKPDNWKIPASRSVVAYLKDDFEEAKKQYEIATDLYKSEIPNSEALKIPYLVNIRKQFK